MEKTNLLLLHGALGNKEQFTDLGQALEHHFNVHSFDFSGHGAMALKEGESYSMPVFAQNILDYMDSNAIAKADVFGYSMGGYAALYLCTIAPERLNKIYTLGTKICWTAEYAAKETRKLDADIILQKVPAFAAELENRHKAHDWKEVLMHTRQMMEYLGENNHLTEELLKSITHTVRLAQGDRDNTLAIEETLQAYRALPNASFEIYPSTHHPFEKVSIDRLVFAIYEFFAE
jgi:pimeloyl-ACP methyl ester carboxylesterase